MLVYKLNSINDYEVFDTYNSLRKEVERNELDIIHFDIPKEYRYLFKNEQIIDYRDQYYVVKNIEEQAGTYYVECLQDIGEWTKFNLNDSYTYDKCEDVLNAVKPFGWQIEVVGNISELRTIKSDHRSSFEILKECLSKYNVEYRLDNKNKILKIGKNLGYNLGSFFSTDFNIDSRDVTVESFEFATRIIPEGMNGLKINQINDGKDYLENNSYSNRLITYYWKDERYTNIQNLKNAAQKKLDELSKPALSIKFEVKNLNDAVEIFDNPYKILDYVYLIDEENKINDIFKIVKIVYDEENPLEDEITLNNVIKDLVSDENEVIELTKTMWEYTRSQFDVLDEEIKGTVETAKRYTDDSFKTYKTERVQTDNQIREFIEESTTYVDPETGQIKPVTNKLLEINKDVDGIEINLEKEIEGNKALKAILDKKLSKEEILEDPEITDALKGEDGKDGVDGETPKIIDGMWVIGDTATDVRAEGKDALNLRAFAKDITDNGKTIIGFCLEEEKEETYPWIGSFNPRWNVDKSDMDTLRNDPKNYIWTKRDPTEYQKEITDINQIVDKLGENYDKTQEDITEINGIVGGLSEGQKESLKKLQETLTSIEQIQLSENARDEEIQATNELINYVNTQISSVEEGIANGSLNIDNLTEMLDSYIQNLPEEIQKKIESDEYLIKLKKSVVIDSKGISIGQEGSRYGINLDNEALRFYNSSSEVAYINSSRLYIQEAEILSSLKIFYLLARKYISDEGEKFVYFNWVND